MGKKRLNDTKAVIAISPHESQSDHYSRTVRKIDNGYVTTSYEYGSNNPNGPVSKEVFTTEHPDMMGKQNGNSDAMKRAIDCLKN